MQNRRMYVDDSHCISEALNEKDENKSVITVISNYYLHIFNQDHEDSEQRYT